MNPAIDRIQWPGRRLRRFTRIDFDSAARMELDGT